MVRRVIEETRQRSAGKVTNDVRDRFVKIMNG